jgi:hypothetical protein
MFKTFSSKWCQFGPKPARQPELWLTLGVKLTWDIKGAVQKVNLALLWIRGLVWLS